MTFFPIINIIFLVILYHIHRKIFLITTIIEILIYLGGVWYIESKYSHITNQFLYYLALSGAGLIVGFAAFFIAITLNHQHLYAEEHLSPKEH